MREILASIDIGSSKIKMVVGEFVLDKLNVLCALDEESRGVSKSAIVEPSELEYAINKLLNKSEEILGVRITKTIVTINEESADFKIGKYVLDISKSGEITASDIDTCIKKSAEGLIDQGYELVSVIPIMFKVDDKKTRIPKNMQGNSLSVKSVVVSVPKRDIYNPVKCLEKCGVEVVDIMPSTFASYYAYKNETLDSTTGIIVDCGGETTKLAAINKGIIVNNLVIGVGGQKIDKDISFVYKIKEDQSKQLKEKFALANKRNASSKDVEIVLNKLGEKTEINQYEVTEVAMSRVQDMLSKAKNEINYLTKKEISYIIVTGGLSEFKDFSLNVESVFGKKSSIGRIMIVGARDNKYAACIGMIKYFKEKMIFKEKEYSMVKEEEIESIIYSKGHKNNGESILGKVFGIFFDN